MSALLRGGEELIKFQDIEHTVESEAVGLFLLCILNSITAFLCVFLLLFFNCSVVVNLCACRLLDWERMKATHTRIISMNRLL